MHTKRKIWAIFCHGLQEIEVRTHFREFSILCILCIPFAYFLFTFLTDYTPFLHKLLLYRDSIREDFGLPGGLHENARPDAYNEVHEDIQALFHYKTNISGSPTSASLSGTGFSSESSVIPPLIVAAGRGNVDALNLLLLFGEGNHARRSGIERALYVAAEQGNVACVSLLLGRVPLRPPKHPQHIAKRLGLIRETWSVYKPGYVYEGGVSLGPNNVAASIAGARMRAEFASATGQIIGRDGETGPRASATAAAALSNAQLIPGGAGSISGQENASSNALLSNGSLPITPVEATAAQAEVWENDGRYRRWCHGYYMGTYWYLYDTAIANWEKQQGIIGEAVELPSIAKKLLPKQTEKPARSSSRSWRTQDKSMDQPKIETAYIHPAYSRIRTTLNSLPSRLSLRIAPGTIDFGAAENVTPAYVAQGLLTSRLPQNAPIVAASKFRNPTHVHSRLPDPIDYGFIASEAIGQTVRLNVGPVEGRTPLVVACEKGRLEIVYLLLAHADPKEAASGTVPELPPPKEADPAVTTTADGATELEGAAAAGPGAAATSASGEEGAPRLSGRKQAAIQAAKMALSAIVASSKFSLCVPTLLAAPTCTNIKRRRELYSSLLGAERDRVDVDLCVPGGHTPLCLASERGDDRLVALLLHWGADANKMGKKEAKPLLVASMAGHEHVIRLLLRTCTPFEIADEVMKAIQASTALSGVTEKELTSVFLRSPLIHDRIDNPEDEESDVEKSRKSQQASGDGSIAALAAISPSPYPVRARKHARIRPWQDQDAPLTRHLSSGFGGTTRTLIDKPSELYAAPNQDSRHAHISDFFYQLVGIGSMAEAVRIANHRGNLLSGMGKEGASRGTAATNAMGSSVAAQSGRSRRNVRRDDFRHEEMIIDSCEPSIVSSLSAAHAYDVASAAVDMFGSSSAASKNHPFDMTHFLPMDEALFGLPLDSVPKLYGYGGGVSSEAFSTLSPSATTGRNHSRSASVGPRTSVLQRALSVGPDGNSGQTEQDASRLSNALVQVLQDSLQLSTAASYRRIIQDTVLLRYYLLLEIQNVLQKSRVVTGVGCIPGRRPPIDVNGSDESGYTPLFIAACAGMLESVMVLLAANADPAIMTKRGKTPIYGAVEKCQVEVVQCLLPKYTAAQLRNNTTFGTNVIHAANRAGSSRIKEILNTYCLDYDAKEAKQIKLERKKQRKEKYGDSERGELGGEAAGHLQRVRRLAEQARRQEMEMERRRLARSHSMHPTSSSSTTQSLNTPSEATPVDLGFTPSSDAPPASGTNPTRGRTKEVKKQPQLRSDSAMPSTTNSFSTTTTATTSSAATQGTGASNVPGVDPTAAKNRSKSHFSSSKRGVPTAAAASSTSTEHNTSSTSIGSDSAPTTKADTRSSAATATPAPSHGHVAGSGVRAAQHANKQRISSAGTVLHSTEGKDGGARSESGTKAPTLPHRTVSSAKGPSSARLHSASSHSSPSKTSPGGGHKFSTRPSTPSTPSTPTSASATDVTVAPVFDRLANRAKEMEARRKAREEAEIKRLEGLSSGGITSNKTKRPASASRSTLTQTPLSTTVLRSDVSAGNSDSGGANGSIGESKRSLYESKEQEASVSEKLVQPTTKASSSGPTLDTREKRAAYFDRLFKDAPVIGSVSGSSTKSEDSESKTKESTDANISTVSSSSAPTSAAKSASTAAKLLRRESASNLRQDTVDNAVSTPKRPMSGEEKLRRASSLLARVSPGSISSSGVSGATKPTSAPTTASTTTAGIASSVHRPPSASSGIPSSTASSAGSAPRTTTGWSDAELLMNNIQRLKQMDAASPSLAQRTSSLLGAATIAPFQASPARMNAPLPSQYTTAGLPPSKGTSSDNRQSSSSSAGRPASAQPLPNPLGGLLGAGLSGSAITAPHANVPPRNQDLSSNPYTSSIYVHEKIKTDLIQITGGNIGPSGRFNEDIVAGSGRLTKAEISARDERNKLREQARLARIEQKRLEDEAKAQETAAKTTAVPANSLALAIAAYGGGASKKKKRAPSSKY